MKVMLHDAAETEHVWLEEPQYDDGFFLGKLGNEPQVVKTHARGEVLSVPESDMSDWLAIDDGLLVGGVSIRGFRDRLPPTQRAEFDKASPFRFSSLNTF